MKYRPFGTKIDKPVSALGFGAMRMPTLGSDEKVDTPKAIEMIRRAIDAGVNYVDTAYPYHGGNSERVVGMALKDGYRDKATVATKLPVWRVNESADCDRIFDEQRRRLDVDFIDYYLLHSLQDHWWEKMLKLGAVDWIWSLKEKGRVGHVGFSFHDHVDVFKQIVDAREWDFCQIQYNLVGEDVQAGTEGLEYAGQKGLGVVVMEPLFGGTLANPPEAVQKVWDEAPEPVRPVDMALRWLWSRPEVSVVLSGMSSLEQVRQNVESAERSGVGTLSAEETALLARVQQAYRRLSPIPCTKCGDCMPCPSGVDIPLCFELFNDAAIFHAGRDVNLCSVLYHSLDGSRQASACVACGQCEEKCPQRIEIIERLIDVDRHFAKKEGKTT